MLLAGSIALVSCDKEKENNNPSNPNTEETTYIITVSCNDAAMGTVTKTPDSAAYHSGTEVTITATPNDGYMFIGWTGAETIAENTYTFTVSANATYTANFEARPQATYNAIFDGSALDIAGYSDFQTNGTGIWLAQFAKDAEGTSVYFPYLVMWMEGDATNNFAVAEDNGAIELYKDTYYTAGTTNYGDWQYYATNNMNCTLLDMTTLTVSFTGSFKMYNLGDIVNGAADDPAQCTQKDLNVTFTNCVFEDVSGNKGLRKKNIKK